MNNISGNPDQDFSMWVRKWIHYDTLIKSLYKQITKERKIKDQYEIQILDYLKNKGVPNAIVQTQQGKYQPISETHSSPLSMIQIESLLHKYFQSKGATIKDESSLIISFLKANRSHKNVTRLREITNGTANSTNNIMDQPKYNELQ
jgi:hypothetical protein